MLEYLKASYREFSKNVEFPKWADLQSSSTVVAVTTILLAVFLFAVDRVFSYSVSNIIYKTLISLK